MNSQLYDFPLPTINWLAIAPIAIVVVTGVLALLVDLFRRKGNNGPVVTVSILGLILAAVAVVLGMTQGYAQPDSFAGMYFHDAFGSAIELIILLITALCVLFSDAYLRERNIAFGEFYPLVLWSASGAMMMATTQNLMMVFIGLEVLSIALYVLTGLHRTAERSEEAAIKYFLLGAFASGFLLYGIALFYGATGGLSLALVPNAMQSTVPYMSTCLLGGLALILVGLGFKNAFVPFHQWVPDVYQGSPTNVTAFMSAAAKLGAMAVLWRVLDAFSAWQLYWMPALFWMAILTMTVGNLAALVQKDVKRILGYSSIAHAGYMLVAVLAHAKDPKSIDSFSLTYYLLSYSLMTIGAFAVLSMAGRDGKDTTRLEDLKGLAQRSPFAATCLTIFMVSLVGLPPTAGFIGKLLIFNDAMRSGLTGLAIVLAVNSAISCYYYLGIVMAAITPETSAEPDAGHGVKLSAGLRAACLLCSIGVFAAALFASPLQLLFAPR